MYQNITSHQITQLKKLSQCMQDIPYCWIRIITKCNKMKLKEFFLCDSRKIFEFTNELIEEQSMISMRLLMLLLRTSPICYVVLVCLHCVQKASHLESVSSFSARFYRYLN